MNWRSRIASESPRERKILLISLSVALITLLADQATKWYVVRNYQLFESRDIIPGLLSFTSVRNLGAAWSIFSGYVWPLLVFSLVAGALMIFFFRKLAEGCMERYFGLMLVLSGIAGNSFDRAFHGAVVDFIHVHYYDMWHYPVFNVADIAICTGVGIYMLSSFLRKSSGVPDLP